MEIIGLGEVFKAHLARACNRVVVPVQFHVAPFLLSFTPVGNTFVNKHVLLWIYSSYHFVSCTRAICSVNNTRH